MAITAEDGTGLAGAETYATVSDFETYASARGLTLATDTEGNKEQLLRKASDYIEGLADRISGVKSNEAQALQFPRYGVYIFGYALESNEIPQRLKDAQCQLAFDIEANDPLPVGSGRETIREKVGPIEREFSKNGSLAVKPKFTKFEALFSPFLKNGGGLRSIRV